MANALYPKGKEKFLGAQIDCDTDTIKAALVSGSAVYSSSDEFWSALSANVIGTPATLSSVTLTGGVFNAANVTYTAVSGPDVEAIVIYKDTGSSATSPLVAWIDTSGGNPILVTPDGGDIRIIWDTGANKIFKL